MEYPFWQSTVNSFETVSYTHLDVYKRKEWTDDHAHAAGYAFILVDGGASLFIALDGFYTAGTFAGAFFMGDGIVRTDSCLLYTSLQKPE